MLRAIRDLFRSRQINAERHLEALAIAVARQADSVCELKSLIRRTENLMKNEIAQFRTEFDRLSALVQRLLQERTAGGDEDRTALTDMLTSVRALADSIEAAIGTSEPSVSGEPISAQPVS